MHPATIGRYELRAELGAGGFATVYRAYDPGLEREVALKLLHGHLARDPNVRARFLREGRALARLKQANLVVVYEAGEDAGAVYLAMELVEGQTLEDCLAARGPLPLAQVVTLTEQVAAAVAAVHARNLIHRDIKPANIMLEVESGRAVLLDLGVARDLDTSTLASGWLVGTPQYMAPEQVQMDGRVTPRTDVYQLAATVYALLADRPPFVGQLAQVLDAVKLAVPADLQTLRPDLPAAVVATVVEGLAKDPERRPPGPREFAAALRRAATDRPLTVTVHLPIGWEDAPAPPLQDSEATVVRRPARRRWYWLGAGAVVLALVGGVLLARARDDRDGAEAAPPAGAASGATVAQVDDLHVYRSASEFLAGRPFVAEATIGEGFAACYAYSGAGPGTALIVEVTGPAGAPAPIERTPPFAPPDAAHVRCEQVLTPGTLAAGRYTVAVTDRGDERARTEIALVRPALPSPSPVVEPVPGPTFVVNTLPAGCHQDAGAEAPVVLTLAPGSVQSMDAVAQRPDGTWHREVSQRCWVRTDPGPVRIFSDRASADAYAATLRPAPTPAPAPTPVAATPQPRPSATIAPQPPVAPAATSAPAPAPPPVQASPLPSSPPPTSAPPATAPATTRPTLAPR